MPTESSVRNSSVHILESLDNISHILNNTSVDLLVGLERGLFRVY